MIVLRSFISVEKDDNYAGKYMVVIRRPNGDIIGIPLRNASKKVAGAYTSSLGYAFEFGVDFAAEEFSKEMKRFRFELEEIDRS